MHRLYEGIGPDLQAITDMVDPYVPGGKAAECFGLRAPYNDGYIACFHRSAARVCSWGSHAHVHEEPRPV